MIERWLQWMRPAPSTERPLHRFNGGVVLEPHKAMSLRGPIETLELPEVLYLPLQQNIGSPNLCKVKVGEQVLKGQVLAASNEYISAPVHAPTSGSIEAIEERSVPHPSGLTAPCIVLKPDGLDQWIERPEPLGDGYMGADPLEIRTLVREAGLVGLGGAAFPTSVKLNAGPDREIGTLIINAAECEPYISCDNALIQAQAAEILQGVDILMHISGAMRCLIGIEEHMDAAIAALRTALEAQPHPLVEIVPVPTRYPTGGEKQLIKVLTGLEVPSHGLPSSIGVLCQNVGTTYALQRLIYHGEPLISRVVTVTGHGVRDPKNVRAPIGTPIQALIRAAGGRTDRDNKIIVGGPMMGFALQHTDLPLVKSSNCILVGTEEDFPKAKEAHPCIRCGECVSACPAELLPQQLQWYARTEQFDLAKQFHLFDCIECGCCEYVCPSQIPLVQYYRYAKSEIQAQTLEKRKSDQAKMRHDARQARFDKAKREREARMAAKKAAAKAAPKKAAASTDAVNDAVERAKQKKAPPHTEAKVDTDAIAAAKARAAERKAAKKAAAQNAPGDKPLVDADAIAAAKARAAERKAAKQASAQGASGEKPLVDTDAIAAAKARAAERKAKKLAAAQANAATTPNESASTAVDGDKPLVDKDAIAAAKARAAARKAAKQAAQRAKPSE